MAGTCKPQFSAVKEAFIENLSTRGEIGAAVSVTLNGERVVDLWGGFCDGQKTRPWQEDTLVCVMSATKAIASLAILALADRGLISVDDPVAKYWPAFGQFGKEDISIRCVLAQMAGLPVAEKAPEGSLYYPGVIEAALEVQTPRWKPWTQPCYHSFTHGPLCQKIMLKVTGKTLGAFLREDLLGPLGIEFYLGMNEEQINRCADISIAEGVPSLLKMQKPGTLMYEAWRPMPKSHNFFQDPQFRSYEFASGNGHSNARALAAIYGILSKGGSHNGHHIIGSEVLNDAIREQWDACEAITERDFRYGTGFMLNNPYFKIGTNRSSFGHPGLGGPMGFADPENQLGFGYCCNYVHAIQDTGPCAEALISSLYDSL
ncbi:beta-lactamase [Oleiphilus messinensis]|uniref:Beta-lactamase n=1 Tax=Oleiphilus messinensis TaxID=141451 RepID=A0A1Y0I515_9GAMM|nr:serine hydrolase domain-containing protein [Oleiphilus messinensis]ARU54544.1 beta-lactamase [Oleiphilus messinensis]